MTIALAVLIPLILTYQLYGYWVFRGKVDIEQEATTA
jgi:cytochrome bd-type quinol oxidase subunit 2